ncbi:hypothetical protein QUF58_05310 [Anaerolineales bacterium HSG24]|nr:hypothetical protein [Anaerolineales bacterium HSG24]
MKNLAKLLNQLEEDELSKLCQDYFPDMYETFTESTSHVDMRHKLLNFADLQILADVLAHHPSLESINLDQQEVTEEKKESNLTMPKLLAIVALMAMLFSVLAPFTGSLFETIGALFN